MREDVERVGPSPSVQQTHAQAPILWLSAPQPVCLGRERASPPGVACIHAKDVGRFFGQVHPRLPHVTPDHLAHCAHDHPSLRGPPEFGSAIRSACAASELSGEEMHQVKGSDAFLLKGVSHVR